MSRLQQSYSFRALRSSDRWISKKATPKMNLPRNGPALIYNQIIYLTAKLPVVELKQQTSQSIQKDNISSIPTSKSNMSAPVDPAAYAKNPAVLNVIYPATADSTFNMEYYIQNHMPFASKTWGPHGLKGWKVIKLDTGAGYQVQAFVEWESVEKMTKALQNSELTGPVMADIPNFTNVTPLRLLGAEVGKSA